MIPIIVFVILLITLVGFIVGDNLVEEDVNNMRNNSPVINSQLYANRYRKILNKYLLTNGYVSLERIIFYLQRTNNVLKFR